MKKFPVGTMAALLAALVAAGCGDLFLSKETRQRIEAVKAAVRRDPALVNALDAEGHPPLHWAVIDSYASLLDWLLDHGANPNVRNARGETALHIAAVSGHAPVVAELLARGADPGQRNEAGHTALEAALARPAMRYREGGAGPVNVDAVVDLLRREVRTPQNLTRRPN